MVATSALLITTSAADVAAQSTTQACVDAHGEAQVLASETKIVAARNKALICAQDDCPNLVKSECIGLVESLRARVPSVVFAISGPGGDLSDVVVEMDGQKVMDRVTGASLDVDPGQHTFVFRAEGYPAVDKRLVVREGEKRRIVQVKVGADVEPALGPVDATEPTTPTPVAPGPDASRDAGGGVPIGPVILGGVGLVGLGLFATFGALGMSERADLEACKPTCSDDEVEPVRTKLIIADVSLAVGVVSLGVATIMLLSGDDESDSARAPVSVMGGPLKDGGLLGLGGFF